MSNARTGDQLFPRPVWGAPPHLGGWCHYASAPAVESLAAAGFDWCCIDRQHGFIGPESLVELVLTLEAHEVAAFVRVASWDDVASIGQALDAGAYGVIVPMVDSVEQARAAAAACTYPPHGTRSWGPTRRKLRDPAAVASRDNADACCLVMIETAAGLANVADILEVDDVHGAFVGPADLALALDSNGDETAAACATIASACSATGKRAGIFGGGPAACHRWLEVGFDFIAVNSDSTLLSSAARAELAAVRASADELASTPERAGGALGSEGD